SLLREKSQDPAALLQTARAYEKVGTIRMELGQVERAAEAFRNEAAMLDRMLARDPSNRDYRLKRAWCFYWTGYFVASVKGELAPAAESHGRSVAIMERLVADFPGDARYRYSLAVFLTNWTTSRMYLGETA